MLRGVDQSRLILLNIDKPLKKATLHKVHCSFVTKPYGTKLKPVGRLGPDGGWFEVSSEVEAIQVAAKEMPAASFVRCPRCF
jgi:hypothetical protein